MTNGFFLLLCGPSHVDYEAVKTKKKVVLLLLFGLKSGFSLWWLVNLILNWLMGLWHLMRNVFICFDVDSCEIPSVHLTFMQKLSMSARYALHFLTPPENQRRSRDLQQISSHLLASGRISPHLNSCHISLFWHPITGSHYFFSFHRFLHFNSCNIVSLLPAYLK